jgi:hypothetical protein
MPSFPSNIRRTGFKRKTLLNKLASVVAKLPQLDLPATITAIYAFGSILRDKEWPHDLDAICLYSQTPEQHRRWETFQKNFSTVDFKEQNRRPIRELWDLLEPHYQRGTLLSKAVENKELAEALAARGVEPQWARCFSWTEVLHNPIGFFFPSIDKILRGSLFKRAMGLSVAFVQHDEFVQGKSGYSHLNCILAWNPQNPDIEANLSGRTNAEKTELLLKELEKFQDIITELKSEYEEVKSYLVQAPNKVKLDYDALEKSHCEIAFAGEMTYQQLVESCEKVRSEMRKYQEEIAVLKTIKWVLPKITAPEYPSGNPVEELVAYLSLSSEPKYEVKEKRIREILETLGLPQDKVRTIKKRGSRTEYELIKPMWKKRGELY